MDRNGGSANPKGFFEHTVIREHITKPLLTHLKCDPLGVKVLPPVDLNGEMLKLAGIIQKIIETEGYKGDVPWLYKDAKLTLLWPFYKKAFPDATWVVVKRDEKGFIDSCLRTPFMKQHSQDRDFWKIFAREYQLRLEALKDSGVSILEISSPDIIKGNFSELKDMITKLELEYREEELKEFISPAYWHGDSKESKGSE